jgi:two-component system phosphate regulon response regulator PhoB
MSAMSQLILVVEDEADLALTMKYNLQREGYDVRVAPTGLDGLAMAQQEPRPDLVLLDLMLPDVPGTEVCRRLRTMDDTADLPIIMVTARGEEVDRIVGLEMGADDYVVKPYSVREVLLRVRAVLKRKSPHAQNDSSRLELGLIRLDVEAHRVWVNQTELELTILEFNLLRTFIERKGRTQSRVQLLDEVWGVQTAITTRTIDVHIKRLRDKLGVAGDYIQTVRGVGYRLVLPDAGVD